MAKMPQERLTTGIVTLVWPHVHAPDTRFDDEGHYKTDFTADAETAQAILQKAKALVSQARKQGLVKAKAKSPAEKNDDGTFNFKAKTKMAPALFDSQGEQLPGDLRVAGGTRARVAVTLRVYEGFGHTGVTMYLNALQIIDLKTFDGVSDDPEFFGFDATEGFTADEIDTADDTPDNPFDEDDGPDEGDDLPWDEADDEAEDEDLGGDF